MLPPEGSRVNLGFLYVRGASMGARGGVVSLLYDVVRRIRLFVEDWTLLNHKGQPHLLGLWDQVSSSSSGSSSSSRGQPHLLGLWDQASRVLTTAHSLLVAACCLLLTAYCLLPTACCLLPTAYRLLTNLLTY